MAITGQWKRRRIVINADAYISGATSNVPVLVKFNSTSHPDLFATGDDKDSVWFSSDASGQTTLYHEGVVFDSTDAIFYVKVDLSSTADTVIYFWYGTPSITGTESINNTWYAGYSIHHFQDTLASSISGGYSFSMVGSLSYSSNGVSGKALTGWSSSNYLTASSCGTIFNKAYSTSNDDSVIVMAKSAASGVTFYGGNTSSNGRGPKMYSRGGADVYGLSDYYYASVNPGEQSTTDWVLAMNALDGATVRAYIYDAVTGYKTGSTTTKTSYSYSDRGIIIGRCYAPSNLGSSDLIDFIWVFTEDKSADYFKAVYNNHINYSTFITIDGAVSIGSSPKMVYPVWPTSTSHTGTVAAGIGLAAAISTQSDFNRSVSSGIGIAAAATRTGTLSRSVEAGIGLSASATPQRLYSKSVDAGLGIAGSVSTSATFSRSVEAGIGIAGAVTTGHGQSAATSGGIGISASVSITGDFSIPKYWGISILHGVTTTDLYGADIIESASITDQLGKRSDEFEIRIYNNEGTYSESFAIGDDVYFYLGYTENPTTKIFHGVITSIEFDLPRVNENTMIIQGVDYGTFRLGQTMVAGIQEYINMTPTAIIQSLLNTYCPDITYTNVATFVDKIPNIKFAWEYVGDCVEMLATLVGADFYVDENDDLHFYDNSTMTSDHTISSDELISARIQKDSYKHYDRVYVIGGKEKYLDVNNATATTAIDTYAKYYASAFTVSKNNLLYVSAYIKKVGEMIEDLPFEIVEDDGAGDPLGDVVAWGKFPVDNISTDAAWVQSTMIDAQLSTAMTYWIVFKLVGRDSSNTYQIYHDNATANGHEDSDDGTSSWTDRTGLLAFKTYYGVQIIKSSTASQKIAGEYYTDILVADPNIEDFSTAEDLATQKVAEYALKHTSDLVVKSKFERFRSGDVVSLSITGLPTLEDQTILSTSMNFTEPTISTVEIQTTPTFDFYTTFAGLFADLRKLKIKAMYLDSNLSNDYLAGAETVTPAESATMIEALTSYVPLYDDTEAIWGVSKWQ